MTTLRYGLFFLSMWSSGCSILVGSVKPMEEKAVNSPTGGLPDRTAGWKKLEIESSAQSHTDIPDAAWKSVLTSSVISINSVCDRSKKRNRESLKSVTQTLLSQWDRLQVLGETQHTLSGFPAMSTIAEGMYSGESRKFKITIVKSPSCIYDLVLVSPKESFERDLSVFQSFHDNLNLK
jgi:hypothetical protein